MCLVGWLLDSMLALRHNNGAPLVRIYGPTDTYRRGGTIAFNFYDLHGRPHDYRQIEALAARANISLRTGCFCNPGAGEIAHNVTRDEMAQCFVSNEPVSFDQFYDLIRGISNGKNASTVRISVGLVSNFADAFRFIQFARGFLEKTTEDIATVASVSGREPLTRDTG